MTNILAIVSLLVGIVALIRSTLERRAPNRLPIANLVRDRFSGAQPNQVLIGLAIGSFVVLAPVGILASLGWVQSHPAGEIGTDFLLLSLATIFIKFVWAAIEELIFRGAILPQVSQFTNGWVGLAASSLFFAWGHLERSGAWTPNALSMLVFGLDGIGFGLAFLATRNLWMPTFWHAAKNIWIWLLFSQSTLQLTHGFLRISYSGPALWVGTSNQAGILDVILSALAVIILYATFGRRIEQGMEWVRNQ
jgi:membrane protease YdiL (CAAX protease family)